MVDDGVGVGCRSSCIWQWLGEGIRDGKDWTWTVTKDYIT